MSFFSAYRCSKFALSMNYLLLDTTNKSGPVQFRLESSLTEVSELPKTFRKFSFWDICNYKKNFNFYTKKLQSKKPSNRAFFSVFLWLRFLGGLFQLVIKSDKLSKLNKTSNILEWKLIQTITKKKSQRTSYLVVCFEVSLYKVRTMNLLTCLLSCWSDHLNLLCLWNVTVLTFQQKKFVSFRKMFSLLLNKRKAS